MLGGVEIFVRVSCMSVSEPVRAAKRRSSISSSVGELESAEGMVGRGVAESQTLVLRDSCGKDGKRKMAYPV